MLPSFFRGRRSALSAVAVTATLGLGGVAVADNLLADGDGLAPVGDNNMSFGTVACNSAPSKNALLAIVRQGSGNVFKNNTTATIAIQGITGTNAADLTASVSDDSIALPNNWEATSNGTRTADTATATVTPRTTSAGFKTASINFTATGTGSDNSGLTRPDDMTVTWTVDTCSVADTTPPTASATALKGATGSQSPYNGSWTNQDVAVTLNAEDNRSGVQLRYTLDGTDPTATHGTQVAPGTVLSFSAEQDRILQFVAVDAANNVSSPVGTQAIRIDKTRPTISASRHNSDANGAGWNNGPVTVRFTCGDTGGSGLAVGACPSDEVVTSEGRNQSRSGSVADVAGNAAPAPASVSDINIDTTPPSAPTAATDRSPEDAVGNWFKNTVTVSYTGGTDPDLADGTAGSGIVSRTAPQTFSATGSHIYEGTATDAAGNTTAAANAATDTVKVDATLPVVALTGTCPTAGTVGEPVSASWQASDVDSGLQSAATGSVSDTLTLGSTSLSAVAGTAKDKVGLESLAAPLCTVRGTYASTGFLAPLANQGVNAGKTGRTYPVKWRLSESVRQADGSQKLEIISDATGIALAQQMSFTQSNTTCESGSVLDPIDAEAPTGATTSITYDTDGDQFHMNYKAPSTQGCYRLMFYKFNGLQARPVDFKFTK